MKSTAMKSTPIKSTLTKSTYKTDETKALYIDHIYGGALLSDPLSHSLNGQLSGGLSWVGWVIMFLSNNHVHSFPLGDELSHCRR